MRSPDLYLGALAVVVVGGMAIVLTSSRQPAAPPIATAAPASAPLQLAARGIVEPIARAKVATMGGGVVTELSVQVGQAVSAQQPIARITLGGQTELLVAPWRGTVTGLNVHLGDTLLPGTVVVTVGDLSRYQVETTNVDEYLVSRISPGDPVALTVPALDQPPLYGFVRTVSLQPSATDGTYAVVIDLANSAAGLRPGMTVRVIFLDQST